jgi:DNA-binding XRE family transcriptional regulator
VRITRLDGLSALVEPLPALDAAPMAPPPEAEAVSVQARAEPAGDPSLTCGALLRRYRQAAGLTQEDLAERAGLSVRAISDLERGLHRSPQRDTVRMLADALNLPPDERAAFEAAARTR